MPHAYVRPSPDAATPNGEDYELIGPDGQIVAYGRLRVEYLPSARHMETTFVVSRHVSTRPMTDAEKFLEGDRR